MKSIVLLITLTLIATSSLADDPSVRTITRKMPSITSSPADNDMPVKTVADKPQTKLEENRSLIDSVKPAGATNITLASGVVYTNAVISRIEADGLVLKWKSGTVKVLFTELTKKSQLEFGYNPVEAVKADEADKDKVVEADDTSPKTGEQPSVEEINRRAEEGRKKIKERQEKRYADDKAKSEAASAWAKAEREKQEALQKKMDAGHSGHKPVWHRYEGKWVYD